MDRKILINNKIITNTGMINPHFTRKVKKLEEEAINWVNKITKKTLFLDDNCSIKERIYCIINNITSKPTCYHCGKSTKLQYHRDTKSYKFTKYCSPSCAIHYRDEDLILQIRKATNKRLYGDENIMNIEKFRDKQLATCYKSYKGRLPNQSHISDDAFNILNDKNKLKELHHGKKMSMNAISYILGVNGKTVAAYIDKHNIKKLNFTRSMGEIQICEFLDSININYVTNDRDMIGKELDIYIPDFKIAIEYCGLYWHADFNSRITKYSHRDKQKICNDKNIQLLTIFEDEWNTKKDIIIAKLKYMLFKTTLPKIYARNTKVVPVEYTTRKSFLDKHHIQGNGSGTVTYGLEHNKELVACVTFIKLKNNNYILNRYATSTNVLGGFTKLLSHFERLNEWNKITTFADLRWSNGNLYSSTGWIKDKILPPDYCYIDTNKNIRVHKFNYRRKYLPKRLKQFDPNLSERENCDMNRIPRLWDCGKIRFIKTNQ